MSTETTNHKLIKPTLDDPADITFTNLNWDKIDGLLGRVEVYEVENDRFPFIELLQTMTVGETRLVVCAVKGSNSIEEDCWLFSLTRTDGGSYNYYGEVQGISMCGYMAHNAIFNDNDMNWTKNYPYEFDSYDLGEGEQLDTGRLLFVYE